MADKGSVAPSTPLAHRALEVELDERGQPVCGARAGFRERALPRLLVLGREVSQRLLEQLVLAAEVQVDDALAQMRLACDVGHRRFREALLRHGVESRLDELLPAHLLRGRPPARTGGGRSC